MEERFNEMQMLKRRFFAMRNGIVADAIRRSGAPYRIVFGLTLPQIADIAREAGHNPSLAFRLMGERGVRESQLAAPMLMEPAGLTADEVVGWLSEAVWPEVVDVACLKMVRRRADAAAIAGRLAAMEGGMARYAALRLWLNILPQGVGEAREFAAAELGRGNRATARQAAQLLDEIEFLSAT